MCFRVNGAGPDTGEISQTKGSSPTSTSVPKEGNASGSSATPQRSRTAASIQRLQQYSNHASTQV